MSDYPHTCDCGSPCYKGATRVECSNAQCHHYKRVDCEATNPCRTTYDEHLEALAGFAAEPPTIAPEGTLAKIDDSGQIFLKGKWIKLSRSTFEYLTMASSKPQGFDAVPLRPNEPPNRNGYVFLPEVLEKITRSEPVLLQAGMKLEVHWSISLDEAAALAGREVVVDQIPASALLEDGECGIRVRLKR